MAGALVTDTSFSLSHLYNYMDRTNYGKKQLLCAWFGSSIEVGICIIVYLCTYLVCMYLNVSSLTIKQKRKRGGSRENRKKKLLFRD